MNDQLHIYTIPTCRDCTFAKQYFNENHISFSEFNCENNEAYAREVRELTGKQTVPTIVINDKVFVGFAENLKKIREILNID